MDLGTWLRCVCVGGGGVLWHLPSVSWSWNIRNPTRNICIPTPKKTKSPLGSCISCMILCRLAKYSLLPLSARKTLRFLFNLSRKTYPMSACNRPLILSRALKYHTLLINCMIFTIKKRTSFQYNCLALHLP